MPLRLGLMDRIGGVVAALLILPVALQTLYTLCALHGITRWVVALACNGTLAGLVLIVRHYHGRPPRLAIAPRGALRAWLWMTPAALVAGGAFAAASLTAMAAPGRTTMAASDLAWLAILIVPFVEETLFRAGIGDLLRSRFGLFLGGYLSACCFSLTHGAPDVSGLLTGAFPSVVLGPLLLGFACEVVYVAARSLTPAIALHTACNATVVIFASIDARWLNWLEMLYG